MKALCIDMEYSFPIFFSHYQQSLLKLSSLLRLKLWDFFINYPTKNPVLDPRSKDIKINLCNLNMLNALTPLRRVLLGKLLASQPVKKFPTFYKIYMFITLSIIDCGEPSLAEGYTVWYCIIC